MVLQCERCVGLGVAKEATVEVQCRWELTKGEKRVGSRGSEDEMKKMRKVKLACWSGDVAARLCMQAAGRDSSRVTTQQVG